MFHFYSTCDCCVSLLPPHIALPIYAKCIVSLRSSSSACNLKLELPCHQALSGSAPFLVLHHAYDLPRHRSLSPILFLFSSSSTLLSLRSSPVPPTPALTSSLIILTQVQSSRSSRSPCLPFCIQPLHSVPPWAGAFHATELASYTRRNRTSFLYAEVSQAQAGSSVASSEPRFFHFLLPKAICYQLLHCRIVSYPRRKSREESKRGGSIRLDKVPPLVLPSDPCPLPFILTLVDHPLHPRASLFLVRVRFQDPRRSSPPPFALPCSCSCSCSSSK
jgi:hypothetical protein